MEKTMQEHESVLASHKEVLERTQQTHYQN
jgi:hypothetical protein